MAPYLTPTEVRARVSVGSPVLDQNRFPDPWVARQVTIWEKKLERHTGDAYVEREAEVTVAARCSATLILPNVHVSDVTVTVDGDAVTLDENQPAFAAGLVQYATGFRTGQTVVASYTYVQPDADLCEIAFEACVRWIERIASMDRSGNTRDVARQGFEGGASTVFVQPDPENGKLTGFSEVDELVNILPRYVTPGIG